MDVSAGATGEIAPPGGVKNSATWRDTIDADIRYEAQKRDADARNEALMELIDAQIRNADARYEGLTGQIEGVLVQVEGLQKQVDGLQNQIDGLNRNAGARSDSQEEQAESARLVITTLRRKIDAIRASLDFEQDSGDDIRAIVEVIVDNLEALQERISEFESMIELDDGEIVRQESHLVSFQ